MRLSRFPLLRMEVLIAGLGFFVWPSTAWANPIIHPIALVWPAAWIILVPVVLIEAIVAIPVLGVTFLRGLWLSFVANLLSTAIGVPIGTCLNPLPLMFIGGFAEASSHVSKLTFLASLLIPLYLLSVLAEGWAAGRLVDRSLRKRVWRWSWLANGVTYGFISAGLMTLMLIDGMTL